MELTTPVYTGNKVKDRILFLLVCGVRVERTSLALIHESYKYISKQLAELQQTGLIKISKTRPTYVTLTAYGVEYVQVKDRRSYEHYMKLSGKNHYGGSQRHIEIMRRASSSITMMNAASIPVGPQNPTLAELLRGEKEKLPVSVPAFYLNREIKYSDEQKQSRTQTTRASGVLFSEGVRALVYSCLDGPMRLPRRPELEANIRLVRHTRDIYKNPVVTETQDSIVLCKDDETACEIFHTRAEQKGGVKMIGDAIWDKTYTGTGFRYIPMNEDGVQSLKHITRLTREDFLQVSFTDEERQMAEERGCGDGIIRNLVCYEYLSCNVSKLAYVKRTHRDLSGVGIICWEGQAQFVKKFFGKERINARVIKRSQINRILNIEE